MATAAPPLPAPVAARSAAAATAELGLTETEAARRAAGQTSSSVSSSRTLASIVRANVFTLFNAILTTFGVLTLVFGDWRDALFLGVVVANSAIGIAQELRAKRKLDRLAALVEPRARVVRDGRVREVDVDEVVLGDLVRLEAGDQVVADGTLAEAEMLALDESVLTGESDLAPRAAGEQVRSGSFAVEGVGAYVVTAYGRESYAQRVAGDARRFRHPRSPLERALNRLLAALVAVMVPLGLLFAYALWRRDEPIAEATAAATAGIVNMVPEGLILLASVTFAAAAIQLARRGALAQQLNAIESLASVDVVCLDKTGTLTEGTLRVVELVEAPGVVGAELASELGRFAGSAAGRNRTLAAISEAYPSQPEPADERVPFSSGRGWSAIRRGGTWYVLGAPEHFRLEGLAETVARQQAAGRRVVAFGTSPSRPVDAVHALGIAVLSERLRPEARRTVEFLRAEGVEVKILSGDAPATAAAIARDAGIPTRTVVDAGEAEDAPLEANVVGRISPEGKRRFVERLAASGRYVAMVGDGVNDVPALKAARLAIAQGSGTDMARSVADVVLVGGDFGSVPLMVGEGRRILRNVQRVAKLFVAKSVFAAFLILLIGITDAAYPLLPRHLTLAGSLTVGIPGFFLALAPSAGAWRSERFLRDVAHFALPAGAAAGIAVLSAYHFALDVAQLPLIEARSVATTTLVVVGLYLVLALEADGKRRGVAVGGLCVALAAMYAAALALPFVRGFFELVVPGAWGLTAVAGGAAVAIVGLVLTDESFLPGRPEAQ